TFALPILAALVLDLEVPRRHVLAGLELRTGVVFRMRLVVFVDDLKGEGVEDGFLKTAVHPPRVVGGDEAQLRGEVVVEVEDAPAGPITRRVVVVAVRTDVAPGVRPVELRESLVHNRRDPRIRQSRAVTASSYIGTFE